MSRPAVVVINRWSEHYARYESYVDHGAEDVCYITTEVGLGSVPTSAAHIELVSATDDLQQLRPALARIVSEHGVPRAVVALKEDDLLAAASLREEWRIAGPRTAELVPFRDKLQMTTVVRASGLQAPEAALADSAAAVVDFATTHGWPVVIKPRIGSSSEGVTIISAAEQVEKEGLQWGPNWLVQSFDDRPIHHVDGIFDGSRIVTGRVSRYLNTCLGFRDGTHLGSVELDDQCVISRVTAEAQRFLAALTTAATPFHLEVFVGDDGDCAFLEVGARVGGAEIPLLWREVHGVDLMAAAFALQAGDPVPELTTTGVDVGGWLLVPAPAERPCRATRSTDLMGTVPELHAQVALDVGQVLPDADAYYEHVGGRFRFRAASTTAVTAAIEQVSATFVVDAEPLPPTNNGGTHVKDYSVQVLPGEGVDDYARYMRTDTLLSLQRTEDQRVHRDELLFQVVHQSTELWLKLACAEIDQAAVALADDDHDGAIALVDRAVLAMRFITDELDMMTHLSPWDFQLIRTVLGHGSGADSPGWRAVRSSSKALWAAFDQWRSRHGVDLIEQYRAERPGSGFRVSEALIAWDEGVSLWRVRHYKMTTRVIGGEVRGTQGTPVDVLVRLIDFKFFPELWQVRTTLTLTGPMAEA